MIIFNNRFRRESVIDKLKRKDWERAMQNISDAEIISIDPDPLHPKEQLPQKEDNNGREERSEEQV